MLAFCGQDRCLVDGNGRIRLTQRFVDDFLRRCNGEIVMHGLPEGAIALYPEEVYSEMRQREISALDTVGSSFLARRSLRRFGALTQPETISRQGRITLLLEVAEKIPQVQEVFVHSFLRMGFDCFVVRQEVAKNPRRLISIIHHMKLQHSQRYVRLLTAVQVQIPNPIRIQDCQGRTRGRSTKKGYSLQNGQNGRKLSPELNKIFILFNYPSQI